MIYLFTYLFKVFENIDKKYSVIELDQRNDGDDIQDVLGELTGTRTVSNSHTTVKSIYKKCFLIRFDEKRPLYTPYFIIL